MIIYSRFLIFLIFVQSISIYANENSIENEVSRPNVDVVEKIIVKNAIVGFSWVDQPLNKILLIKNGKNNCAIKYLSFSRGNDSKKETAFNSGEESFYGEADFYSNSKKKINRLKLKRVQTTGIGKLILFSHNNNYIFCGNEKLIWEYPTATSLLSDGGDVSLAVTRLDDFNKINFEDRNLEWFKFEEGRKIQIK